MQDRRSQPVSQAAFDLQSAALELPFAQPPRVLDLGSGCGIVGIMLALQRPEWQVEGLEIQPGLHELALSNASLCGVSICFRQSDLRGFTSSQPYDLILANPPWQKSGSGRLSPHQSRNLSRFELLCTLSDVLDCLNRNLTPQGTALLIYPKCRLADIRAAVTKTLLDIISLFPASGSQEHVICRLRLKG